MPVALAALFISPPELSVRNETSDSRSPSLATSIIPPPVVNNSSSPLSPLLYPCDHPIGKSTVFSVSCDWISDRSPMLTLSNRELYITM